MKLLTIRQAAAQINVCRTTLRAMIDDGRIRAKNIARPGAKTPTWRVVAESLQEFRIEPLGAKVLEERLREAVLDRRVEW
jgi:excisionase family DNA binding protein